MCIKKYTQVLGKKCKCRVGNFKMKKAGDTNWEAAAAALNNDNIFASTPMDVLIGFSQEQHKKQKVCLM